MRYLRLPDIDTLAAAPVTTDPLESGWALADVVREVEGSTWNVDVRDHTRPEIAYAYLVLVQSLRNDQNVHDALARSVDTYLIVSQALAEQAELERQAERERYAETMRQEAISRAVECPHCGQSPGTSCRSAGPSRAVQTNSHQARVRLARSLNDGVEETP